MRMFLLLNLQPSACRRPPARARIGRQLNDTIPCSIILVGALEVHIWLGEFVDVYSPNSLLLGVLNALKNGHLGAGWSGRVPGRLVSHFLLFVSQFFSFVSQARCLWSGSRLACLPLPFICLPLLFICLPLFFIISQAGCFALFCWACSISIHLSPM